MCMYMYVYVYMYMHVRVHVHVHVCMPLVNNCVYGYTVGTSTQVVILHYSCTVHVRVHCTCTCIIHVHVHVLFPRPVLYVQAVPPCGGRPQLHGEVYECPPQRDRSAAAPLASRQCTKWYSLYMYTIMACIHVHVHVHAVMCMYTYMYMYMHVWPG